MFVCLCVSFHSSQCTGVLLSCGSSHDQTVTSLTWIPSSLHSLLTVLPPHCAPSSLYTSSLLGSLFTVLPLLCASSSLCLLENILRFAPHSFSNHGNCFSQAIAPHCNCSSQHSLFMAIAPDNHSSQQLFLTTITHHNNCS